MTRLGCALRKGALVLGALFVASVGSMCLVSFGGQPSDLCAAEDCSGHGTCEVEDGVAACVCEPGYSGGHCEASVFDGGLLDGGGDSGVDAGCVPSDSSCIDDVLTLCATDTGAVTELRCPLGCAADELRCLSLVPSNVSNALLSDIAPDVIVGSDSTVDTQDCDGPFGVPEIYPQQAGPELCVLSVQSFQLAAGARITVVGSRPLVILATGAMVIEGIIDASANGTTPGPGGARGGRPGHSNGEGVHPGIGGTHVGSWADGGGGGGGLCGAGGHGGNGSNASGGNGGGAEDPAWELSPLIGGSGGGMGPGQYGGGVDNVGRGGAGGGAVQLTSAQSIVLDGIVIAGGGGGRGGSVHDTGVSDFGAGGGGGSGGVVLLEAPQITIGPGGAVGVSGGGGGGGSSNILPANFEGQDGGILIALGGPSGGSEYGSPGGDGNTATTLDGSQGGSNSNPDSNGGGGGGGSGCVLLRTGDGLLPDGTAGFHPQVSPGLRALPALRQ